LSFEYANRLGKERTPFLIVVSYDKSRVVVVPISELQNHDIEFEIDGNSFQKRDVKYSISSLEFEKYREKFQKVITSIRKGYTYVLNLTSESEIEINSDLKEIYKYAEAKYKIRFKDEFLSYSPETFVKISQNRITAFPMKGTLDGSVPNGDEVLLSNQKELAEHVMIVDLLRNDLNMVATKIRVEEFRTISKIRSGEKELFQMSSKIVGDLENDWQSQIGTILEKILPAGSITGTPKKRTVELISEIEEYHRGFFSGVFGIFDGENFDSGVMIRFLEKRGEKLFYKSGGGITLDSRVELEYREMIDKVYLF
jgi:para-aminobenzoate synthetase component 1